MLINFHKSLDPNYAMDLDPLSMVEFVSDFRVTFTPNLYFSQQFVNDVVKAFRMLGFNK